MRILIVVFVVLLLLTPVAFANSSYTYTIRHDVELQLDGEWKFESIVATPAQGNVDIVLDGVGTAYLKSMLEIIEKNTISTNWFDLF